MQILAIIDNCFVVNNLCNFYMKLIESEGQGCIESGS